MRKRKVALCFFVVVTVVCKSSLQTCTKTVHCAGRSFPKFPNSTNNSVDFTPPKQRRLIVVQSVCQSVSRVRWYSSRQLPIDTTTCYFTLSCGGLGFLLLVLCLVTSFGCKLRPFFCLTLFLTGFNVPPVCSTTSECKLFLQQTNSIQRSLVEER